MTLVASFIIDSYPLMLSDILLSAPETVGEELHLPTIGNITQIFPPGSGFVPSGLKQKIAIIEDNLIIGWAGSRIAAKTVIKEIIELNHKKTFTLETLKDYFDKLDEVIWNQGVNFIGFIIDPPGSTIFAPFGDKEWWELESEVYGKSKIIGSGAENLANQLIDAAQPVLSSREVNKLENVIMKGITVIGEALSLEITTGESLLSYFGGGYEIASIFNGKFRKLDNITHLFWNAEVTNNRFAATLNQICKYSYNKDILLIRSGTLSGISEKYEQIFEKEAVFIVEPVYRNIDSDEIKELTIPDYNSRFICNYFIAPNEDNTKITVYMSISFCGNETPALHFKDTENGLVVRFEKRWFDEVISNAHKYSNSI